MRERLTEIYRRAQEWRAGRIPYAEVLLMFGLGILLFCRLPGQVRHPYIWVEEGTIYIPDFLQAGWAGLFHPVAGYMVLTCKLITLSALSLSPYYYPEIAVGLTFAFSLSVLAAVVFAPTELQGKAWCAAAVLLVPIVTEVYLKASYFFWFTGILIFLALLWRRDGSHVWWRSAFVVLGGLSTPILPIFVPLFALRALLLRGREWRFLMLVILAALPQAWIMSHSVLPPQTALTKENLQVFFERFVGMFFAGHFSGITFLWVRAVALVVVSIAAIRGRIYRSPLCLALLCGWALTAIASVSRINVWQPHPLVAGPRYFFYPYLFLAWLLIQLAYREIGAPVRASLLAVIAFVVAQSLLSYTRPVLPVSWRDNLDHCARSTEAKVAIPFQSDGRTDWMWSYDFTPQECRRLGGS